MPGFQSESGSDCESWRLDLRHVRFADDHVGDSSEDEADNVNTHACVQQFSAALPDPIFAQQDTGVENSSVSNRTWTSRFRTIHVVLPTGRVWKNDRKSRAAQTFEAVRGRGQPRKG